MPLPNLLSLVGLLTWVGYEVVLRSRDASTLNWRARSGDRGSTYLLLASYVAATALDTALRPIAAGHLQQQWRWAGVAMVIAGLLLRAWGMRTLGSSYTRTLRTRDGQSLVQDGPYRLIRHPGYAGSLLTWTGYALGTGNWISAILTAALLLAAYTWRISAEEKLLATTFGPEYSQYRQHTRRLVPFLY
jgi:protein-S-isoprenylcysteine O-methyltransferase Ste14